MSRPVFPHESQPHLVDTPFGSSQLVSDFLLAWLRQQRRGGREPPSSHPKLILMSATLDAAFWQRYVGGSIIRVPGRTFPIRQLYLEHIYELLGETPPRGSMARFGHSPPHGRGGGGGGGGGRHHTTSEVIDYRLLERLLVQISLETRSESDGAVLVFLSGAREIERFCAACAANKTLRERTLTLPLHGSLSGEAQRRCFAPAPKGLRKVVVATNVAESAVTIADVTHVIDTGRVKQLTWDAERGMSSFEEGWCSAESAAQRRGRAGRLRPGVAYALWPEAFGLEPTAAPEMERSPLEAVVLQASLLGAAQPAALLSQAPQPPPTAAVRRAYERLAALQAVRFEGGAASTVALTPLGAHLASLPLDPRVGKMLILSCALGCPGPMLTAAAALGGRGVFYAPEGRRAEASRMQRDAFGAHTSDTLATCAAYAAWELACRGGGSAERRWCEEHFVVAKAMRELGRVRQQLLGELRSAGLLSATAAPSAEVGDDGPLLRAIICAGLYPNVARATRTRAKRAGHAAYEKISLGDTQAWIHPSSMLADGGADGPADGFYAFVSKVQTPRLFLRELSTVTPLALLLFGALPHEVSVEKAKQMGRIELMPGGGGHACISVRIAPEDVQVVNVLRMELDRVLRECVSGGAAESGAGGAAESGAGGAAESGAGGAAESGAGGAAESGAVGKVLRTLLAIASSK